MTRVTALALLLAGCDSAPVPQPAFEAPPNGAAWVVDAAQVLPDTVESALDSQLAAAHKKTKHQMIVVTLSTLGGRDIAEYAVELGRQWQIGREKINDGVLLIVAPNERKVRIEVGYGLEAVLRDEEARHIIDGTILPHIVAGDIPGGIQAGTAAVLREIEVPGATP